MNLHGSSSAADCVTLWEQGQNLGVIDRSLLLVSKMYPQIPFSCLADASIGFINRALLASRFALFGNRLDATMQCPECRGKLDLVLQLQPLLNQLGVNENRFFTPIFEIEGHRFRPPTSRDLATVSHINPGTPALALLNRCRVGAEADKVDPAERLEQVADSLEKLDPALDIRFDLTCDHCDQPIQFAFDVGEYLWLEFDSWVRQLLEQVHLLASTYCWSEQAILAMSQQRRNYYVKRVQG